MNPRYWQQQRSLNTSSESRIWHPLQTNLGAEAHPETGPMRDGAIPETTGHLYINGETPAVAGVSGGGRTQTRTADLCRVKAAL